MTDEPKKKKLTGTVTVTGENPLAAGAPLFSNFVAISHVASEIQLEFVFLDLNVLAHKIDQVRKGELEGNFDFQGKTVAKVVVPAAAFLQLKNHLTRVFDAIEGRTDEVSQEETTERGQSA